MKGQGQKRPGEYLFETSNNTLAREGKIVGALEKQQEKEFGLN